MRAISPCRVIFLATTTIIGFPRTAQAFAGSLSRAAFDTKRLTYMTRSCAQSEPPAVETSEMSERESTDISGEMLFGRFRISASQIFYRSPSRLSAGIVNLRPIVPGHVLIIPRRVVPFLSDLTEEEYQDLWMSVRKVQTMLGAYYDTEGFNVAVQDGAVAGQSVPHVHVHILPRKKDDFERNDDIYDKLEEWAPRDQCTTKERGLHVPEDEDRRDRTMEEMNDEAEKYRHLFRE